MVNKSPPSENKLQANRFQPTISTGEKSSDSKKGTGTRRQVPNTRTRAGTLYQASGTDVATFKKLQAIIVPLIMEWATTAAARTHKFYKLWETYWKAAIDQNTTFTVIKRVINVTTLRQYYEHIIQCPAVFTTMDINYDEDDNKIHFRLRLQAQEPEKNRQPVPQVAMAKKHSHEDTFVVTAADPTSILPFNHAIFATIRDWAQEPLSGIHSFYQTWTKWQALITETTPFSDIQQILGVRDLQDYATIVKQCPSIEWTFEIKWDPATESILWNFRDEPITPQYRKIAPKETSVPAPADITTTEAEIVQHQGTYQQTADAVDIVDSTSPVEMAVIMKLTQQSSISTKATPTDSNDEIATELMLDIEEEDDPSTGKTFKNRFIHRFLDTYNAKMGAFGNYIKMTQENVTHQCNKIDTQLQVYDQKLKDFTSLFNDVMNNAHKEVQEMDAKVSFFNTTMDQRVDTAASRISQACTYYTLQMNKLTATKIEEFQQEIQQDLHEAVQSSIDNHLAPLFDEQTETIEQHGESLLTTLDAQAQKHTATMEKYVQNMKDNVDKSTSAESTVRNTATRWKHVTTSPVNQTPPTEPIVSITPLNATVGDKTLPHLFWIMQQRINRTIHSAAQRFTDPFHEPLQVTRRGSSRPKTISTPH